MKPILSIFFFAIAISASGQNYNCLQSGPKNYFINGNSYVRGIRIDSVRASGSDSIFYPYRTQRISNYIGGLGPATVDTFGASWLGKNVIKQPDGTFVFDNYWDTVFIKSQAHTGDSWIFFNDTTSIYYTATVTSEDTMTILGSLDSVKKITITADSAGFPYPLDPVNNFHILLSKNNGFAQIFDLYTFPYHRPNYHLPYSNFIRWYDYYLDVLLGNLGTGDIPELDNEPDTLNSIFHLFRFHNPTLREIYDFNIGDVYEYDYSVLYSWPMFSDENTVDSITGKTTTPYSVTYTGSQHNKKVVTDATTTPPVTTTTYTSYPFGQAADTSVLIDPKTMPEEWNSGYLLHYYPNLFLIYCDSPASYQIDVDYHGGGFVPLDIGSTATYSYSIYSVGFGLSYQVTSEEYAEMYGLPYQELQYVYYQKNGSECGSFQNASVEVPTINRQDVIYILPNPAKDHIDITSDHPFAPNTFITVYDMSGRSVFRTQAEQQNVLTVSTASWVDGLYMVIVQDSTGIIGKEKVVIVR